MPWNWQLPDWPNFTYDSESIASAERIFLIERITHSAYLQNLSGDDRIHFIAEILSLEGVESSKIEGEILNRSRLLSLIQKKFERTGDERKEFDKETGMAELLYSAYATFEWPLTHEMLWEWHDILCLNWSHLVGSGHYRTHDEPMQITSGGNTERKVHFEAPPSKRVHDEMTKFIDWYNSGQSSKQILGRASLAHVYFESIHPFEHGNGLIGRVLVEKALSQGVGKPVLIAISKRIEARKKEYYAELEKCNRTLKVDQWAAFFADRIIRAQQNSINVLRVRMQKSKLLVALSGKINRHQEKALLIMFEEEPGNFFVEITVKKYISITQVSPTAAGRDLDDLVAKGALLKMGELKHTCYLLNLPTVY